MHPGRTHVMPGAFRVLDRLALSHWLTLDLGDAARFEFVGDDAEHPVEGTLYEWTEPPVDLHALHAQRIALVDQGHAAVGIGLGFDDRLQREA